MVGGPEYFKKWYEGNRSFISSKRKLRYKQDQAYRLRALQANKQYYTNIRNNKVGPLQAGLCTMAQAAAFLKVSPNTLRKRLADAGIHPTRSGKSKLVPREKLLWLKK